MTGYLKERYAVYATYIVTDHIACDQAPHWGKKEKIIEIGEKKNHCWAGFARRYFPTFFCLFPPLWSLVPGYRSRIEDTKLTKPGGGGGGVTSLKETNGDVPLYAVAF